MPPFFVSLSLSAFRFSSRKRFEAMDEGDTLCERPTVDKTSAPTPDDPGRRPPSSRRPPNVLRLYPRLKTVQTHTHTHTDTQTHTHTSKVTNMGNHGILRQMKRPVIATKETKRSHEYSRNRGGKNRWR